MNHDPLAVTQQPTKSAPEKGRKRRIFLIDDHPIVQQALAEMLNHEEDLEVCGTAKTPSLALEQIEKLRPDLVILDLALPGANGIEVLKDIRVRWPKQMVLMLSMHDESLYGLRALRAGAVGYVMKVEATEKLLDAIHHVLEGGVYLSERMQKRVIGRMKGTEAEAWKEPLDQLSDRELEVLRLLGQALGTRQIAKELHLSVKTIESHRAHLKQKLNLKTGSDLVQYAIRLQSERFDPHGSATAEAEPEPAAVGAS